MNILETVAPFFPLVYQQSGEQLGFVNKNSGVVEYPQPAPVQHIINKEIEEERKRAMDGWLSLHIRPSNIGSSEPSPIDSIIAHFRGVSAIIVTLKGIHEVRPVELRSSKEFKELDDRAWKTAEVLSKTAVEMPKSYKRKNKIFFWARILSNELEVVITFHGSPLSQSISR